MTQAALHRLVFLVGTESDRIGFEIRSLQEFTAAEALMEGGDLQVRSRLEQLRQMPTGVTCFFLRQESVFQSDSFFAI